MVGPGTGPAPAGSGPRATDIPGPVESGCSGAAGGDPGQRWLERSTEHWTSALGRCKNRARADSGPAEVRPDPAGRVFPPTLPRAMDRGIPRWTLRTLGAGGTAAHLQPVGGGAGQSSTGRVAAVLTAAGPGGTGRLEQRNDGGATGRLVHSGRSWLASPQPDGDGASVHPRRRSLPGSRW